jgi:hypothetical protein
MKVWYFIQSHKNPNQIYRLVRTIKTSSPSAQIIIGHDFTKCHLDMAPLQDLSDVYLLKGDFPVEWGNFSLMQPYLNAIQWLLENNFDFDWLVYLSGQDYPTQPLSKFEDFLAQTEYDGFMLYADALSEQGYLLVDTPIERYFYQYYRPPKWARPLLRIPYKILIKIQGSTSPIRCWYHEDFPIGLKALQTPFNENFICYSSSSWYTFSRKCVEYISDFISKNSSLIDYYKRTIEPDESLIATIVANNKSLKICNDHQRYIEFPKGSPHPRILTEKDYPTLTNGKFYFARKFEQYSKILDMLDAHIFQ